jgi:hypothetical protein
VASAMEMLRVIPLALALVRRFLPPNLTEKERQTTVFGIRPLADPDEFDEADNLAQIVSKNNATQHALTWAELSIIDSLSLTSPFFLLFRCLTLSCCWYMLLSLLLLSSFRDFVSSM